MIFIIFVISFLCFLVGWFVCFFCPSSKFKLTTPAGTISNPIIRPRSINGLADQAAAALTDGQYIEKLQISLQQASVSSLHERLAERKLHSIQIPVGSITIQSYSVQSYVEIFKYLHYIHRDRFRVPVDQSGRKPVVVQSSHR